MFISKCALNNILIDITRDNCVNFREIMYGNEAKRIRKINSDNLYKTAVSDASNLCSFGEK